MYKNKILNKIQSFILKTTYLNFFVLCIYSLISDSFYYLFLQNWPFNLFFIPLNSYILFWTIWKLTQVL